MKNKILVGTGLIVSSFAICFGCATKKVSAERSPEDRTTVAAMPEVSDTSIDITSPKANTTVAANPNLGASSSGRSR